LLAFVFIRWLKNMRLLLLGPPGSGKGTQAKLLCERLHLYHFGMGDLLREAIRQHTPAGTQAESYIIRGQLAPDEVVNQIVAEKFAAPDRPVDFVMDGYPRTLAQAEFFDALLQQHALSLDAVVQLLMDEEEIVQRLSGRRVCPTCESTYHVQFQAPRQPDVCDACGHALERRADDRAATVRQRLAVYHQTHDDLIAHYEKLGLLRSVPAADDPESVYARLVQALPATASDG
jgi:adenylate kinase